MQRTIQFLVDDKKKKKEEGLMRKREEGDLEQVFLVLTLKRLVWEELVEGD